MKCRDRKTHVSWRHYHPESFCTFLLNPSLKNMPKCTYFLMVWKLSGWSGNFLDDLETFRMIWKLSGWFGNFPNDLETFRMIWKLSDHLEPSGWFRNFPDGLEVFGSSGKCLDNLETFWRVWQLSRWSENILTNFDTLYICLTCLPKKNE